jgi:hypothetical protein
MTKFDMEKVIVGPDGNEIKEPISETEVKAVTLKSVCFVCLMRPSNSGASSSMDEILKKGVLAHKIMQGGSVDLTPEEIVLISGLLIHMPPAYVYGAMKLLDPSRFK